MKRGFQLIVIVVCLSFISCKKDLPNTAMIIRDCTGTYLRMNKTDYKVCTLKKVAAFKTGSIVSVSFKKIPECNGDANLQLQCYMLHNFESWIKVEEIR